MKYTWTGPGELKLNGKRHAPGAVVDIPDGVPVVDGLKVKPEPKSDGKPKGKGQN